MKRSEPFERYIYTFCVKGINALIERQGCVRIVLRVSVWH